MSTCLQNGPALLEGGDLQEVVPTSGVFAATSSPQYGHAIAVADRYKVSRQVVHLRLEQLTTATHARQIGGVGRWGRARRGPAIEWVGTFRSAGNSGQATLRRFSSSRMIGSWRSRLRRRVGLGGFGELGPVGVVGAIDDELDVGAEVALDAVEGDWRWWAWAVTGRDWRPPSCGSVGSRGRTGRP